MTTTTLGLRHLDTVGFAADQGGRGFHLPTAIAVKGDGRIFVASRSNTAALNIVGIQMVTRDHNFFGQIGPAGADTVLRLTAMPTPAPVHRVACGYYHTCALTINGAAVACGSNQDGQLGLNGVPTGYDNDDAKVRELRPVALPSEAAQVACGAHHTFAVAADGALHRFERGVSRTLIAEIWVAFWPSGLHSSKISAIILRTGPGAPPLAHLTRARRSRQRSRDRRRAGV